ncbi:MAG: T9SS type A sorting domain-containing protein [Bacteroidia bacterium]|nr:T9SS type A sorting domain-containing protein [Bacteroidia bacterium]
MMYRKIIHIIFGTVFSCFGFHGSLFAQSPFTGGDGDGTARLRLTQVSPCDPIAGNPFGGGGGGSTNNWDSIQAASCAPVFADPFSGGNHDGFSANAIINAPCKPVLANIYSGGNQDGFGQHAFIASVCYSVIITPFNGGNHDGFSQNVFQVTDCKSVIINPFSGGFEDGFAENKHTVSDCKSVIITPFSGGNQDGFSASNHQSTPCYPILASIFGGGNQDGFSASQYINSNCLPELFSIYNGGAHDGHAGKQLAAALGFSTPIPALTGVCVNNDAVIGLAPGDPSVVYQWEISSDGGLTFSNLSNGGVYSGANTDSLWIKPATNPLDGNVYRVFVSYPGCSNGYSDATTLDVGNQPVSGSIVKDPNQDEVCPGVDISATFNSGTGGAGDIDDIYLFSVDTGNTWSNYVAPTLIPTGSLSGIDVVQIKSLRTTNGQGCIPATANLAKWTVAGIGYWVGAISADWNTQGNWGCGVVPTISTDVTIPQVHIGNSQPNVLFSPNAYCRSLVIEPNASVTTYASNVLEVHGDFTNDGLASLGAGTVLFAGTNNQTIGGSTQTYFSYLRVGKINASKSINLLQHIKVAEEIQLNKGLINLNGFDIDLDSTGTLVGESDSSRVTGHPGEIKSKIRLSSYSTLYPNIAGLGIDLTTGPLNVPGQTVLNRGHFSYSLETNKTGIDRYYRIEPSLNSNLDVNMRIHYLNAELVSGNHTKPDLVPWRSEDEGLTWQGQFLPLAQLTNNPLANWVQQDHIPAFSFWTLSDWLQSPLPVELLSFNATAGNRQVLLDWTTASEINSHYFTVERSSDAKQFVDILTQPAAGNSSTIKVYNDIDHYPLEGLSYYRLRQTDLDGSEQHSQIVAVNFNASNAVFSYVDGHGDIRIRIQTGWSEKTRISLYDVSGRLLSAGDFEISRGTNDFVLYNQGFARGVYLLKVEGNRSSTYCNKHFLK